MESVYAKDIPVFNTKYVNIKDILDNKCDIKKIGLDSEIIINNNKQVLLNDINNPLSYVDNFIIDKTLCINPDYLENNKEDVNRLLISFINNYTGSLTIKDTKLINDEVINTISNNHKITEIELGSRDNIYKLKESDYRKLKNGTIKSIKTYGVEEELDFNFDGIIKYNIDRNLISHYTYDVLKDMKEENQLHLFNHLTDENIKYFKLIKGATVCFDYKDYKNIFDSIEKLESINPNFKYYVKVNNYDKQLFNQELFSHDNISNKIEVNYELVDMSISDYLNHEKYLYELIKPAVTLSPYEKFLYAYNITKHYKKYNEVDENDDKFNSRKLYKIIDNDEYMVCVGYANMFQDLLTKLGINSTTYSVGVDVGFDSLDALSEYSEDAISKYGGHSRVIVNLVDPKYGIDGIYQSDPTWDSVIGEDSYIYSTMTFNEAHLAKRYLYQDNSEYSLLSSNTLEEFYNNVNKYMDRLINDTPMAIIYTEEKARSRVVNDLLKIIKKLDINYYNKLLSIFLSIDKHDDIIIDKYYNDFIYDVSNYIVSKINNPVRLEQIKPAITLLYSKFYGLSEEDTKKEVDRTLEFNRKRMSKCFPTTYKINQDGTKEVYSYIDNKFDDNNDNIVSIK